MGIAACIIFGIIAIASVALSISDCKKREFDFFRMLTGKTVGGLLVTALVIILFFQIVVVPNAYEDQRSDATLVGFAAAIGIVILAYSFIASHAGRQYTVNGEIISTSILTFSDGNLTVKQTDPALGRKLRIVENHTMYRSTTPTKLHYGSVTVGGITTGGFYETGGQKQYLDAGKDGTYHIEYEGKYIPKIYITKELYAKATMPASSVKDYAGTDGLRFYLSPTNKSYLSKEESELFTKLAKREIRDDDDTAFNQLQPLLQKSLPTYADCEAIVKWLSF